MMVQRLGSVGLAALSYALVLLSGNGHASMSSRGDDSSSLGCIPRFFGDGDCDLANDTEDCGYDSGDCCECTCVSTEEYTCGENGGYFCVDPSAECVDDDDVTAITGSPGSCIEEFISDGDCDVGNNYEGCGYDGGDCCECDCVSNSIFTCGENADFDCIDPTSRCFNDYVEAGTKTTVGATANAYDSRPGEASGENGCMVDGCDPELTRDGITDAEAESRWSCAPKLVPGGGQCWIEFAFEDPQDVMEMEVAFFKGEQRSRTLEATINGEVVGSFDSYPGSTCNVFGVEVSGVHTLMLTSVGLEEHGWISLLEVRFLVKP